MTPANLSQSAKARLVRQQLRVIEALRVRLGTCSLTDYHNISGELFKAKADLNSLMNLPVKPSPRRGR